MFEFGFQEIVLIMIIALIVVGPERLPGLARKAGMWVSKMRRFVSNVKEDIDKELAAEELKKILKEQADSSGIHEIIEETKETIHSAQQDYMLQAMPDVDSDVKVNKGQPGDSNPEALANLQSTRVNSETDSDSGGDSSASGEAGGTDTDDNKKSSDIKSS